MKKLLDVIKIPVIIILTFIVQIFISNNFEIFGVSPNVILVAVVIISMWNKLTINLIFAAIMGILTDLIFDFDIGKSLVIYLVITLCISYIANRYRKESKAAIIYITAIATGIFTLFQFVYYIIDSAVVINVFVILKQLIVEMLLNIVVAYVLYKIFEKNMNEDILNSVYR